MTSSQRKRFEIAVRYVSDKSLQPYFPLSLSLDEKLKLYGLYKQATSGDCDLPKPGFLQVERRKKWEAHTQHKGMAREEAMKSYVGSIMKIATRDLNLDQLTGKCKQIVSDFFWDMEDALEPVPAVAPSAARPEHAEVKYDSLVEGVLQSKAEDIGDADLSDKLRQLRELSLQSG